MASVYKSRNPFIRFIYLERLKICVDFIREENAGWVLDLGTGNGILLPSLSFSRKEIIGLDIDRQLGEIKRLISAEGLMNCHLIRADAECLPFRSDAFDLIVAVSVFDHLANPKKSMVEVGRVLKPRANLVFSMGTGGPWLTLLFPLVASGEILGKLKTWTKIILGTETIEIAIGHKWKWLDLISVAGQCFKIEKIKKIVGILPLRYCGYIALRCLNEKS